MVSHLLQFCWEQFCCAKILTNTLDIRLQTLCCICAWMRHKMVPVYYICNAYKLRYIRCNLIYLIRTILVILIFPTNIMFWLQFRVTVGPESRVIYGANNVSHQLALAGVCVEEIPSLLPSSKGARFINSKSMMCQFCCKTYKQAGALRRHRKEKHGIST